jgi:hypoxanthine phosphoribosyltransferase
MLPTNVLQLDYQDFGNLVWNHFDLIEKFQSDNNIRFHGVIAKLRNGTIPGSIVANHFNLPMGVLNAPRQTDHNQYEVFLPLEIRELIKYFGTINILFVDSICGTGNTVQQATEFFNKNYKGQINVYSYTTLVDERAKTKPTICGLIHSSFFQPPWEWRSFTPQAHLDRLMHHDIKSSDENLYSVGFSSLECKSSFEQGIGSKIQGDWIDIFSIHHKKMKSTSGISSLEIPDAPITLELCRTKYSPLINKKAEFILINGITHFIENDCAQAIAISEKCPVCNVLYFDGKNLIRIYGKQVSIDKILSLKF